MTIITTLLAPYWQQIMGGIAVIIGAAGLYFKGRSDQDNKAKIKDITDANDIRKAGADARDRVAADTAAGRLRETDGWRRD